MSVNRRDLLRGAAATAVASTLPARIFAQTTVAQSGEVHLQTLSDGTLTLPRSFITGAMPAEADEILTRYGVTGDALTPDCNVTLLRSGDRTVLFDVGSGTEFMPTAGKLADALAAAGVDPYDVTDVIFTHAHPDHLWGSFDDFGDMWFPNATHHIGRTEWDYWTDPNTVSTIGAERQTFAVGAANRLGALSDQISLFDDGAEIIPGVAARATHGHTPGHMSFETRVGNQSVMIVGDAIGNHHVGFERPEWASGSDQDADLGASTRLTLLDQLHTDQMLLIGYHLPNGGIGYAEKRGNGYHFTSAS